MKYCLALLMPLTVLSPRNTAAETALLDVIPADCFAYVAIENIEKLDTGLAPLLEKMNAPMFAPKSLILERLNLGPHIPADSPVAAVLMPASSVPELGAVAVLVLRCPDVETWLRDHDPEKIDSKLWGANLVWGKTFVAEHNGFALLGSSADAVRAVRSSTQSIAERVRRAAPAGNAALHGWMNVGEVIDSPIAASWIAGMTPENPLLGSTILNNRAELLRQIEGLYVQIRVSPDGAQLHLAIAPRADTPLAGMTAFTESGATRLTKRLAKQDAILLTAATTVTAGQASALRQTMHQLLDAPLLNALNAEVAKTFSGHVETLAGQLRGLATSVTATPPGPHGVAVASGLVQVEDASAWMMDFEAAITLLKTQLVPEGHTNPLFDSLQFTPSAELLHGVPVHHVAVRMHAPPGGRENLSWMAMFGDPQRMLRVTIADPFTVAWTLGGQARDMDRLLAAAMGRAEGMDPPSGTAQVPAIMMFSPTAIADVGRTLARVQHNINQAPARTPPAPTVPATIRCAPPLRAHRHSCDFRGATRNAGADEPGNVKRNHDPPTRMSDVRRYSSSSLWSFLRNAMYRGGGRSPS